MAAKAGKEASGASSARTKASTVSTMPQPLSASPRGLTQAEVRMLMVRYCHQQRGEAAADHASKGNPSGLMRNVIERTAVVGFH